MSKTKITIFGSGKMAEAIIDALHNKFEIELVARDSGKLEKLSLKYNIKNSFFFEKLEDITDKNIILCVKPGALKYISKTLKGEARMLYSVMAGVSIDRLKEALKAKHYVRAMPNVGAFYGTSATAVFCEDEQKSAEIEELFSAIGRVYKVKDESKIDVATALVGSSPAFLAIIAEAMIDAGVREGMDRDSASELIGGAFGGMETLLKHKTPAEIKNMVMSPAGTTAEGIAVLESHGVRGAVMESIKATVKRALELNSSN